MKQTRRAEVRSQAVDPVSTGGAAAADGAVVAAAKSAGIVCAKAGIAPATVTVKAVRSGRKNRGRGMKYLLNWGKR
jgi:hypothetical protein